ncbi:NACHT domain-containing protein [Streptomyces radicis]|uniref:NACHT domain-containing protein n=1 Tax=Streptomyces radicis TaxID=1750517 RepID=A0A3A9VUU1_9ACTN|nr:NACHT domain-containing protein [Streptomyces radicis]RKN04539.1 NACHT domain-containing protein [Streptomyces radicis]RKN15517.1 NACHT domain-containing protein [Streptomyces radicis]
MDAVAAVGLRLGSAAVAPLVKRLFRAEQPGAGLVGAPVAIASLVSFRGEKRTLTPRDLELLARELTDRAIRAAGPHDALAEDERQPVARALADTLAGLGDLDMDDVQAVRLGAEGLADALRPRRGGALSRDAELFHDRLLRLACLHIVDFFTRRSTFVARTLVEQSRQSQRLVEALDLLVERLPERHGEDAAFEERYRGHLARRYGRLTIFGIDLDDEWPLDAAYVSLEATESADRWGISDDDLRHRSGPPRRAEQALAGRERVLLRGVAGAGKTTLVQWLAVTTAEHRPSDGLLHLIGRVPFVLPLRALTRSGGELPAPRDFLSAVGCPHTPPEGWAERVLSARRALLLVDGVDEVPEPRRADTRRWLRELLREFPGTACLVTARPSAVREDWLATEDFDELSLAPMSREDVAAFIERWHRAVGGTPEAARALLTAVRSRPDLGRLATNPLMCGLICALHRTSHGYLPRGREELYEAALRMLLERRDRQRSIDHGLPLDARSQTVLLERLAYWLIRNGHSQLERDDAIDLIAQVLPSMHRDAAHGSADEVYRHLLDRSGLLREPADGVVDFVHRTFQDYLAARAAVESRDFPLLVRNAHLDQWEDVIRMAVAHGRPDERRRLLRQLIKRGDTVRKHRVRLHLLAMACLEHAPQLDPDTRREVAERAAALLPPRTYQEAVSLAAVGQVTLQLLPGPEGLTDDEAASVVWAASALGTDAALPLLAEFREHPAFMVRSALLHRWSAFEPERFGAEVLSRLSPDGSPHLQVSTRAELAALRQLPAHPFLALFGEFTEEEIVEAAGERVEELSLNAERLTDLRFLSRFRFLRRLSLIEGPALTDLSPLVGLPLRGLLLRKVPGLRDLHPLNDLPDLGSLYLDDGVPCPDLDALPTRAPLTDLGVPSTTDLTGVGAWQRLETLRIIGSASPTPMSLDAVAQLPALTSLVAAPWVLHALHARRVALPAVSHLHLFGVGGDEDLRHLPTVLPGLRSALLSGGPAVLDPAPLCALDRLDSVRTQNRVRLTNADRLTGVTVSQPLESRY